MKVGRFESRDGRQFWAALDDNETSVREIEGPIAEWAPTLATATDLSSISVGAATPMSELRLRAPMDPQARIFGTGINYPTHIEDVSTPFERPATMPGYIKLQSTVVDPDGEIRYPATTSELDYEVEIVMVLAKPLEAGELRTASLLGYTMGNDASPRDVGGIGGLYSMKAQDQTAPIGPWVTTLAEFGGPGQPSLEFSLAINGEERQRDDAKNMLWSLEEILQFINSHNKLRAGDLIFTGTTGGTGMRTDRWLNEGDLIEIEAEKIGRLTNTVRTKDKSADDW
jgi:2-keto-4-pentenoate hydratase/2-oxohepta-3-ene-1,7-dioic acid hydratase in catechol pathway